MFPAPPLQESSLGSFSKMSGSKPSARAIFRGSALAHCIYCHAASAISGPKQIPRSQHPTHLVGQIEIFATRDSPSEAKIAFSRHAKPTAASAGADAFIRGKGFLLIQFTQRMRGKR